MGAAERAASMSPDDYSGTCEMQRITSAFEESFQVLRADPRVKIVGDIVREAQNARPGLDDRSLAQVDGDLFRINADNRTVVYRLVSYLPDEDIYLAEWPD